MKKFCDGKSFDPFKIQSLWAGLTRALSSFSRNANLKISRLRVQDESGRLETLNKLQFSFL